MLIRAMTFWPASVARLLKRCATCSLLQCSYSRSLHTGTCDLSRSLSFGAFRCEDIRFHPFIKDRRFEMLELEDHQLALILPWLKSQFPRSLPVYHLAHNMLRDRFAWPGMKFLADKRQLPSVCICRPKPYNKKRECVPMENGPHTFVYSSSAGSALRWVLAKDPAAHEWMRSATIPDLDTKTAQTLLEKDPRMERLTAAEGPSKGAEQTCFLFDLQKLDFQSTVPEGFRLGALAEKDVEHVVQNCAYGQAKTKKIFFRYLIAHDFPNVALFDNSNNPEEPIAYCMYMPQGSVGTFYVHSEYREQGLFETVLGELLRRLKELGETSVWMQTVALPIASQIENISSLGGKEYPNHHKCWIGMRPSNTGDVHEAHAKRDRLADLSLTDDFDVLSTQNSSRKASRLPGRRSSLQGPRREEDFEDDSDADAEDE